MEIKQTVSDLYDSFAILTNKILESFGYMLDLQVRALDCNKCTQTCMHLHGPEIDFNRTIFDLIFSCRIPNFS